MWIASLSRCFSCKKLKSSLARTQCRRVVGGDMPAKQITTDVPLPSTPRLRLQCAGCGDLKMDATVTPAASQVDLGRDAEATDDDKSLTGLPTARRQRAAIRNVKGDMRREQARSMSSLSSMPTGTVSIATTRTVSLST